MVSILQECNEITVKHMMLLHVSVMILHANMYGTHVLLFLIWLILYVSVLRTHAFVINSVESRFIFRVGLFNALAVYRYPIVMYYGKQGEEEEG